MKENYKDWQAAIVKILVEKTDSLEHKIKKADLALKIGISFPTLKKIYDGDSELSIPAFCAWCEIVNIEPDEVFSQARGNQTVEAGSKRPLSISELANIVPEDAADSLKKLMYSLAESAFDREFLAKHEDTRPMTRKELAAMGWVNDNRARLSK